MCFRNFSFYLIMFIIDLYNQDHGYVRSMHALSSFLNTQVSKQNSRHTMDAIFSPEPLLDFCMHYMCDYRASPHFHQFLLFHLAKDSLGVEGACAKGAQSKEPGQRSLGQRSLNQKHNNLEKWPKEPGPKEPGTKEPQSKI